MILRTSDGTQVFPVWFLANRLFWAVLGFEPGNGPVRMLGLLDSGLWAQKSMVLIMPPFFPV